MKVMKASEIIEGVIELLSVREHWTQCAVARNIPDGTHKFSDWSSYQDEDLMSLSYSTNVGPLDENAQSWCLGGAIIKVMNTSDWYSMDTRVKRIFDKLAQDRGYTNFVPFNNSHKTEHEDLMLFLKEALYEAQIMEAKAAIIMQ